MRSRVAPILAGLFTIHCSVPDAAVSPKSAPPVYASHGYALTFPVPDGALYCPLPDGWVGSDHGTTLYLELPERCGGAGYSSTSRAFEPAATARILLYYGYAPIDPVSPETCREVDRVFFLGQDRPVCRADDAGSVIFRVAGTYQADSAAEAGLTLVTRPTRLASDLIAFRRLAATLTTCTASWEEGGVSTAVGTGPACPEVGTF